MQTVSVDTANWVPTRLNLEIAVTSNLGISKILLNTKF